MNDKLLLKWKKINPITIYECTTAYECTSFKGSSNEWDDLIQQFWPVDME